MRFKTKHLQFKNEFYLYKYATGMFERRIYFSFDQIVSIHLLDDNRSSPCVFLVLSRVLYLIEAKQQ